MGPFNMNFDNLWVPLRGGEKGNRHFQEKRVLLGQGVSGLQCVTFDTCLTGHSK